MKIMKTKEESSLLSQAGQVLGHLLRKKEVEVMSISAEGGGDFAPFPFLLMTVEGEGGQGLAQLLE